MIERVIHQVWHPFASRQMPRDWQRFAQSWRRWHPHHTHQIWGVEQSRSFVAAHYPDFLATYDAYRNPIQRIDALRILLLRHFGGISVDLDVECLRPVDALLEGEELVLVADPALHAHPRREKGCRQVISTAFMASRPRHPFWDDAVAELERSAHLPDGMDRTGPFVVTRCYERQPDRTAITVASPETFYPISEPECRGLTAYDLEHWVRTTGPAYGVHHWTSTWNRPRQSQGPALRPYDQGLPSKILHPALHEGRSRELFEDGALVSCIMVTRGWALPARWAIEGFRNQSYRNRELVIATTNPDGDLQEYVQSLGDERIRFAGILPRGTPLGAQRNFAVGHARGELISTWDDDDLFGADRLAAGITALATSGAAAAFLERICMWWPARRHLALSGRRHWENTMIARRKALPRYQEIDRAEDTHAVLEMVRRHPVALVDDPNLFVYVVSGNNTWGTDHFEMLFGRATFDAKGLDYERALSVLSKHVPILEYLSWLQERDPKTFAALEEERTPPGASGGEAPATPGRALGAPSLVRSRRAHALGPLPDRPRRFLFAWELGGGLGHTVPLSQVARPLLDAGHEVHLALFDLTSARAALGSLAAHRNLRLWQAPHFTGRLPGLADPVCYAELLFRAGYLDAQRLMGLVDGWDSLLRQVEPDLLVADHAPTALLSARGFPFPRALFGTGFFQPIPEAPLASFREWEPVPRGRLESSESAVLETCNAILAARRQPPLKRLADLLEVDESFLVTVPDLDHYQRRARDAAQAYCGALSPAAQGRPAEWPAGTEPAVFAYVKAEYAGIVPVLKALRDSPCRVLAYAPGLAPQTIAELSSAGLRIVTEPVDMAEVCATSQAIVCHSGSGTVATALHGGKPLVLLPMHVEQLLVSRRVRSMGAGLYLLENTLERLPEVLQRVIADRSFAEAARAFARRHSHPEGNRVAEAVAARCEELARLSRNVDRAASAAPQRAPAPAVAG